MAFDLKIDTKPAPRQRLVMTPQLQQAIKILQLSLPELEAVVQSELDSNPMLEPLDQSVAEAAANEGADMNSNGTGDDPMTRPESAPNAAADGEWEPGSSSEPPGPTSATEAPDAAVELGELNRFDKLDWREYLENYSNNWQNSEAPDPDDERRQTLENTLTRKTSLEDHLMMPVAGVES